MRTAAACTRRSQPGGGGAATAGVQGVHRTTIGSRQPWRPSADGPGACWLLEQTPAWWFAHMPHALPPRPLPTALCVWRLQTSREELAQEVEDLKKKIAGTE
jgi:hypothetical protein